MVTTIKKIRVQKSKDDELVEECRKAVHYSQRFAIHSDKLLISIQTGCGECHLIVWTMPAKATRIDPPPTTVAVIVNLVDGQGAIRTYEKENDAYVDIVGTEEAGNFVIIPWESTWWFRLSRSLRVGHVKAKYTK